jgi:2-amino-4-hydroxy-6-hydroxymethyldihydropteridine diphosphokinase
MTAETPARTVATRSRSMDAARAYLSLGANLGERAAALGHARAALAARGRVRLAACSSVVETAPVDVTDQPHFLNQVLAVETGLAPADLLAECLAIEAGLGRRREGVPPRGPRTIDIDLLLYDGRAMDEPGLTVPHPRLARRPFLLALLAEVGAPSDWLPEERDTKHAGAPR